MSFKKIVKKSIGFAANLLIPFSHSKATLDISSARTILEACSPKPTGSNISTNTLINPICDLQIIIPAYNAEKYLKACMESILNQKTQYSFKIVLVDDGSTDSTPAIADQYISDERVVVIHQENKGFSGSRNRGLQKLFARYVMFVDSDDILCDGAINALLDYAFKNNADIVEGSAISFDANGEWIHHTHKSNEQVDASKTLKGFPWGKVFKQKLFENLCFPKDYWYEDTGISHLIFTQNLTAFTITDMVYKYRKNNEGISIVGKTNPKCVDSYWITEQTLEDYKNLGLPFDDKYYDLFLKQVMINFKRTENMTSQIQESIFVLTCDLYNTYFSSLQLEKHDKLGRALKSRDFGIYKLYCKSHSYL